MSKHSKNNNKNNNNNSRRNPRKPRRRRGKTGKRHVDAYTMMVADPCNATLVPGLFGTSEGLMGRFRRNFQLQTDETLNCGYILWCPDYTNEGVLDVTAGDNSGNLFVWQSASASKQPTSLPGDEPYGTDALSPNMTTAHSLADPVYYAMNSPTITDARCLGACIQMTYFGPMAQASGEIGFIDNLSLSTLIDSPTGSLSVDQLMNYSQAHSRLGVDPYETVFRLDPDSSSTFRDASDPCLAIPAALSGEATKLGPGPEVHEPRIFGMVWRNVGGPQSFSIELTKCVEWRADPLSGIVQTPVRTIGPSQVRRVNKVIDQSPYPRVAWKRKGDSLANGISKMALTGVQSAAQLGLGYAKNKAMQYAGGMLQSVLQDAAPLLLM